MVFEVFDEEDTGSITADKVRWCECLLMVDKVEDHLASQVFFVNLKVYCFSGCGMCSKFSDTKLLENWGFPISI